MCFRAGDTVDFMLSVSVVLPLCIYIGMGLLANKMKLLDGEIGSKINSFAFKMLFPLMMFDNMMNAGAVIKSGELSLAVYLLGVTTVVFLLLLLIVPRFIKSGPRCASFIQGTFRANSILFAMPVVSALCGDENTALAAMCVAVLVPYYNILAVVVLELGRGGKVKVKNLLKSVITNPIIIGAIAGALFLALGITLPELLKTPLKALTSIITPLSLMVLGAGLRFEGIRRDFGQLAAVCGLKLIAIPAVTLAGAVLLGFEGIALMTAFSLTCVPTAVSSFTMAEQMGADGPFAAEVVAGTTVTSIVTVFLWVLLLSGMGLV